jgi:hypothetical protein
LVLWEWTWTTNHAWSGPVGHEVSLCLVNFNVLCLHPKRSNEWREAEIPSSCKSISMNITWIWSVHSGSWASSKSSQLLLKLLSCALASTVVLNLYLLARCKTTQRIWDEISWQYTSKCLINQFNNSLISSCLKVQVSISTLLKFNYTRPTDAWYFRLTIYIHIACPLDYSKSSECLNFFSYFHLGC